MEFRSRNQYREPDVGAYETQKSLHAIRPNSVSLPLASPAGWAPPLPEGMLGNGLLEIQWQYYYAPRLVAAAQGGYDSYVTSFPGHTVPAPGAGMGTRYRGALAIEQFEQQLELSGSLPWIGPFLTREAELAIHPTYGEMFMGATGWPSAMQTHLRLIHPSRSPHSASVLERTTLFGWLRSEVIRLIDADAVPMRELFGMIRKAWNPQGKPVAYAPETLTASHNIVRQFKAHWSGPIDWLAFAFELENVMSRLEYSWPLNISGCGVYNGCWIEVGRLELGRIQCTELAVTARVLAELVNIRTKGFAPIIVNEYGCDTDGTHRLIAAWLWNLFQSLPRGGERVDLDDAVRGFFRHYGPRVGWDADVDLSAGFAYDITNSYLRFGVSRFMTLYGADMKPIVQQEMLRVLTEILADQSQREIFMRDVEPHLYAFHPVTHLPVLLLPEYSCGAVIKGPYDAGEASYRVAPVVYERLAGLPLLALPARGPYHLTDRTILPWFEILEPR